MMGRCCSSIPALNPSELKQFQSINGLQQLAEARRFKLHLHSPGIDHCSLINLGLFANSTDSPLVLFKSYNLVVPLQFLIYQYSTIMWEQAWFLDQFGVLHDGKQPYPGAITTLEKLATCGAKMVVISNSSRRASTTIDKLSSLGFKPSLFVGAITSGELTHQYLLRRDDPWFAALGSSCIHMTWSDRGAISLEGLGLQVVDNVEDAEFILAHGTEALGLPSGDALPMTLEDLNKVLVQCAAKKIPMVIANPDFVTVEARALRVMPGTLAATYEKFGGEVKWMGKPGEIIYKSAMAVVGMDAADCIAVGDSFHHDIKGANMAGISSAFITGGIHATELGLTKFGETPVDSSVTSLATKYEAYPTYVLPSFTW